MQLCRTCRWAEPYNGAFGPTWCCQYSEKHGSRPVAQLRNYYGGNTENEECFLYRVRYGFRNDVERMRQNMSKGRFSSETRELIAQLRMEGKSPTQIAEATGLDTKQVSAFLYNNKDYIAQYADLHQNDREPVNEAAPETEAVADPEPGKLTIENGFTPYDGNVIEDTETDEPEEEEPTEEVVVTENETTTEVVEQEITLGLDEQAIRRALASDSVEDVLRKPVRHMFGFGDDLCATPAMINVCAPGFTAVREEEYNDLLRKVGEAADLHAKIDVLTRMHNKQCETISDANIKIAEIKESRDNLAAENEILRAESDKREQTEKDHLARIAELEDLLEQNDQTDYKDENERLREIIMKMIMRSSGTKTVEDALIEMAAERLGVV